MTSAVQALKPAHGRRVGHWFCRLHGVRLADSLEIAQHRKWGKCSETHIAFWCKQDNQWEEA